MNNRVRITKLILWSIVGFAGAVGITRFLFGLGATTNLTDATPWGIWIGFDVMAGVALAAGGFVITAIFYIFRREEFHSFVRPAVLTAFLGYLAVVFGLLFDLGLPWNIWHMMIYWNPHSPLFEVGWCVMLYTTVLLLEFSPVPLEETSRYAKIRRFLMKFRFPLVLLGIMLSTLHQSSLGSLFLIMPFKLHPLWYSHILPLLFFISAIALGLMMIAYESLVSHWLFRRKPETNLVEKLAKGAVWVLSIYFIIKMTDLWLSGKLHFIFDGSWESNLFILEMLISTVIPIILFSIKKIRTSTTGQWIGSSMVVFGMIFNRINVGGLTMLRATGDTYVPSWMEITISLGVVSAACLAFLFAIERFHIWKEKPQDPEWEPYTPPVFDHTSEVWLGTPPLAARTKYTLVFLLSFALGFALIPSHKIESKGVEIVPVQKARGGDTLFIDGNHDEYGVMFAHTQHSDSLGQKQSCDNCHHMNMPMDKATGCWECHRYMYSPTDAFNHDWHADTHGGNIPCMQCHPKGKERKAETAKKCDDCHLDLLPSDSPIKVENYTAPPYVDAMHGLCVTCHKKKADELPDKKNLALCTTCHQSAPPQYLKAEISKNLSGPYFNHVVIPGVNLKQEKEQLDNHE